MKLEELKQYLKTKCTPEGENIAKVDFKLRKTPAYIVLDITVTTETYKAIASVLVDKESNKLIAYRFDKGENTYYLPTALTALIISDMVIDNIKEVMK